MFDFDIIATTDSKEFVENIFEDELPVYYEPPKPKKIIPTEYDLYKADTFSFGTLIGSITNKGSSGYALLDLFDSDSEEYKVIKNRLKMSCKLQSAQIDKSKIGEEVKGIPKIWVNRVEGEDFNNSILMDRHPYFFKYLYKDTRMKYNKHLRTYSASCEAKFRIRLENLIELEEKTEEQQRFLDNFYKYSPTIDSNSVMNLVCREIEKLDRDVRLEMNKKTDIDLFELFFNKELEWSNGVYKQIKSTFIEFNRKSSDTVLFSEDESCETVENVVESLQNTLLGICSNELQISNYLIYYAYNDKGSDKSKKMLWLAYGKCLYANLKNNKKISSFEIPLREENGDIIYQCKKYRKETIYV